MLESNSPNSIVITFLLNFYIQSKRDLFNIPFQTHFNDENNFLTLELQCT